MRQGWVLRTALWGLVATSASGGCLLVTPLDDVPAARGGASQGGSAGTPGQGEPEAGQAPGGAAGAPDTGACRTNADCVKGGAGAPYLCRSDHTCAPLLSEQCPLAYDAEKAKDPNAIFFGAFAPLSSVRPAENSILWAHRLALQEINGNSIAGVPGGPGGVRRPLVMIVCNSAEAAVGSAMEHLVEELEVPAVLATLRSGDLREQYEKYRSRGVFYLSPIAVSTVVAAENDGGQVWNLLGQPSDFAPTYRSLLERAEAHVRAKRSLPAEQPVKVALVASKDALDFELANAITPGLVINGKSASADKDHFLRYDMADDPNYAEAAAIVGGFHPDIVISASGARFSGSLAFQDQLESEWVTYFEEIDPPRPFYILSPYNAGDLVPLEERIESWLEGNGDDDQQRYVGVSIAGAQDSSLQNTYAVRLASEFGEDAISDTANYYDAVYYLAFAIVGANQAEGLDGTGIAAGMQRLLTGESYDVGPGDANAAFAALGMKGTSIKVQSTLGPPGFDPKTGVRPIDGSVFCFRRSQNNVTPVFDQLRYDEKTHALVGDFACIPGF